MHISRASFEHPALGAMLCRGVDERECDDVEWVYCSENPSHGTEKQNRRLDSLCRMFRQWNMRLTVGLMFVGFSKQNET